MHPTIRVRCPGCDARIKAPKEMLGQTRPCPRCKRRLVIRTPAPTDAQPIVLHDERLGGPPLSRAV
jgi:uncharacterized paraquat-inducible protein A